MRCYWSAVGALVLTACAATQRGAAEASLERASSQVPEGARAFAERCARCHGRRGEGLSGAPNVLGPGALPVYARNSALFTSPTMTDLQLLQAEIQARPAGAPIRNAFRTAQDLYDYVAKHLTGARALTPDQSWAVVSFLVSVQGGTSQPIDPGGAGSVAIPHQE